MDEDEKVTGLCSVADVDPSEIIVVLLGNSIAVA